MPKIGQKVDKVLSNGDHPEVALSIFDLDLLDPSTRVLLLTGRVASMPLRMSNRGDEVAVGLTGNLLEAALTADMVRSESRKAGLRSCRCWLKKAESWVKLDDTSVLTVIMGGRAVFHPGVIQSDQIPLLETSLLSPLSGEEL